MIYELALISVLIGAGYWGWFFLRRRPHGTATFGAMQLAAAALAGLGLLGKRLEVGSLGIAGAIGVGAGACLLVIGPAARALARRMVAAERMAIGKRLLDIAELLAPGSGVTEEKAVVRAMAEIRDGRIDQTIDALAGARARAPDDARLAIDERIAMLYLAAHRFRDAIGHAEAHLFGAPPPPDPDGSLRRALGFTPPVWVDLLGAYGRTGDLDQAARMIARLEDVCAGRDDAALWIHRARVMFLALAGRARAVRALIAPSQSRHMTPAARAYWIAVAHERGGDRAAAARAYEEARARSRGRPRALIDQAIAGLGDPRPIELSAAANEVVARVEAAPLPPPIRLAKPRRPRATWLVTAMLAAASAATAIWVGDSHDIGVLVRSGGLVRGVVAAGEWWRVISCVFVHIGVLHLVVNALGLFVLGLLAEDLFGSARMIAIFGAAGVGGAVASYLASPAGISAGASGAVFGLLGAVFLEITWHRERYRLAWKRGMWGGLAVVAIGQLAYDFATPANDQWAHGAGLLAGAVLGFVLSPSARWARPGLALARALALGFGAASAIAGFLVVQTPLADSLSRGGFARRGVDGVAIQGVAIEMDVPARWEDAPHQVVQPDGLVVIRFADEAQTAPAQEAQPSEARRAGEGAFDQGARGQGSGGDGAAGSDLLVKLPRADEALIALPAGWEGREFSGEEPEDAMGYRQRTRVVVCSRAFGDHRILVVIAVPETIASAAPELFARLLASIGPAGPA